MKTVKEPAGVRLHRAMQALGGNLPRSPRARMIAAGAVSLAVSGLVAVWNISSGPLRNLNDIGGWDNRALFIMMTACVQTLLLMLTAALCRGGYARTLLRQAIVTAGFVIALLPINQKTYAFSEQLLPLIRQMDEAGLAAIAGMETNLSSPALTLIYLLTRGPIYDMYLVKLACAAAFAVLCLMAAHLCDRRNMGLRAEVVLALCLILPQGFMSAACAAQVDVISAAMTAAALALAAQEKPKGWLCAACYALAVAFSGAALYALPVFIALILRKKLKTVQLLAALGAVCVLCVPAMIAGQPALYALASPLKAVLGAPQYASGAPNLMNLFPRAAMEEMPEYFMLSQLEALDMVDPVTNFSPYYTQEGFDMIMRGMALLGLAGYAVVWALTLRRSRMSGLAQAFALSLAAMIACPGATAGAWLFVSVLALVAIFAQPQLRVPACLVLFAAAGAAAYPVTGEILLPMVAALALCLLALMALLGMFDENVRKGEAQ